jgi:hypothetical protein
LGRPDLGLSPGLGRVFEGASIRYVIHGDLTSRTLEGRTMAQGRERTKEQLYREAKRLGVKGRSKMNKGQLKAAVDRRS